MREREIILEKEMKFEDEDKQEEERFLRKTY